MTTQSIVNPFVCIYAHRGILIIDGPLDLEDPRWVPVGDSRIGCVVSNTSVTLGVSAEALTILKSIKKGRDAIGDIDWFEINGGGHAFGWLGNVKRLVDPAQAEGSRQYVIGGHVTVPNDVPEDAKTIIDNHFDSK